MNNLQTNSQPIYIKNPIAGLIKDVILAWYIAPKEVWFMDSRGFGDVEGASPDQSDVYQRFGIMVLDEASVELFQSRMRPYFVSVESLRRMMIEAEDWGDYPGDYTPALIIDFDQKNLTSYYQEVGGEFQDYIPEGWQGRFEIAVPQHISLEYKYWVVNGEDLLKKNLKFAHS